MMKTRRSNHQVVGLMAMHLLALSVLAVRADTPEEPPERSEALAGEEMKPTEIGVRFTPGIAKAVGAAMTKQMKGRYELNDDQVQSIQEILSHQMMQMAQGNAETGRDMFEFMLESIIGNDGSFSKESAIKFAKMSKPVMPAVREFFRKSAAEIGKKLTIKQKLKLTGDMAVATAGLVIFENRMKRWGEGKVGEFANPFFDSNDDAPADAKDEPTDPNESPEHHKARKQVERWFEWQINVEREWDSYVDQAITYYEFDESQEASARAILKDCKNRAKMIKTPQFRRAIKEIRIIQNMARAVARNQGSRLEGLNRGPWKYQLNRSSEELMKPLNDLEKELKLRIDGLPTSQQRAKAKAAVNKAFAEKGVKQLPI